MRHRSIEVLVLLPFVSSTTLGWSCGEHAGCPVLARRRERRAHEGGGGWWVDAGCLLGVFVQSDSTLRHAVTQAHETSCNTFGQP